jgi:thiol-disulfide isomerase/thioredoxin
MLLLIQGLWSNVSEADQHQVPSQPWYTVDAQGNRMIQLYVFWSLTCPHCKRALPFLERLQSTYDWLQIHTLELTEHPANVERYITMAALLGQEARAVPAFLFCKEMLVGFASTATTGQMLEHKLLECQRRFGQGIGSEAGVAERRTEATPLVVPGIGRINPSSYSLPLTTLIIAALDAFNPCAFFVLFFLLSLLVHAHDRRRMLLIGGTFVLCSGAMYFVFMAAWLNLFLVMGHLRGITVGAGAVALVMALLNIKEYVWFQRGPSLTIPEHAKQGLYKRMRALVYASKLPSMLTGTILLALMANTYELLCTAGFPMVFTRILTLENLSSTVYYAYLFLYNIIYVIPLGIIVIMFTVTLGSRKLRETEGQRLKLLSGSMMLNLSLVLLFAPHWLESMWMALIVLIAAVALTAIVVLVERTIHKSRAHALWKKEEIT